MTLTHRWFVTIASILALILIINERGLAQNADFYSPDMLAIQGRWIRSDAPYIIELQHGENNKLQATYFNRRSIHVNKTETAVKDGLQYVMIELQDVNYPGSVYLLSYDRIQDKLNGVYILGANGQRYQVDFSRQKPQ